MLLYPFFPLFPGNISCQRKVKLVLEQGEVAADPGLLPHHLVPVLQVPLHHDEPPAGVAAEDLLAVPDQLEARMTGNTVTGVVLSDHWQPVDQSTTWQKYLENFLHKVE